MGCALDKIIGQMVAYIRHTEKTLATDDVFYDKIVRILYLTFFLIPTFAMPSLMTIGQDVTIWSHPLKSS